MRVTLDLLHEFANTEVFCLFHNCMWQSGHPEVDIYFLALCEQIDGLSTGLFRLRLCLDLSVLTDTGTQLENRSPLFLHWCFRIQARHVCRFPEHSNRMVAFAKTGLPVLTIGFWVFGLGLLGVFTTSSNFWTQFFHPIIFEGNRRWWSRWHKYFLVYDFFRIHHNCFRDTISWECIVEDDCIRSCLIELQSCSLSKFDVDPIHRVLVSFPRFSACTMQDVVCSNQAHADLCDPYSWDSQPWRIPSVFPCLNFALPLSIRNFVMECRMIAHPIWSLYSKILSWINTLSWSVGSMGLRPEWPWRARRQGISCPASQYNVEIFSCCLRLLPFCPSTFHTWDVK